jgi:hypothetical protein
MTMATLPKMGQNREWLLRMADEEAGCEVYACGFVKRPAPALTMRPPHAGTDQRDTRPPEEPPAPLEPSNAMNQHI